MVKDRQYFMYLVALDDYYNMICDRAELNSDQKAVLRGIKKKLTDDLKKESRAMDLFERLLLMESREAQWALSDWDRR